MSKEVTVEELRERLDEIIADIKDGETVTITEDGRSIGTVRPAAMHRGVPYPFRDFDFGHRPINLKTDPAELIIEERERVHRLFGSDPNSVESSETAFAVGRAHGRRRK